MKYPVNKPLLNGNELEYVSDCLKTGWISSGGSYVKDFEKKLSKEFHRDYAICVTNGTTALDIAIEALEFNEEDEIILPSFTIISCINSILRNKLKPVFIDSDLKNWNMDVNSIESKINSKTKAIVVVHIYGLPVDMNPVLGLAKKYNLKIIEDAAEVIGQKYYGKPCGSFGDISTMSFYANKHITTGEGGAILTNSKSLYNKCCSLRNLGFNSERRFLHYEIGFNARMTNLQGALGLAQIEMLDEKINLKRKLGLKYNNLLKGQKGIILPLDKTKYAKNIYWVFGILLDDSIYKHHNDIIKNLNKKGVETRPFFWPLHLQPVLAKFNLDVTEKKELMNSIFLAKRGLYLPSGLGTSENEIESVCKILISTIGEYL